MNIAALFSGAGGLDLGFQQAGFNITWANEYDKTIWDTYKHNHPKTILITKSIREIANEDFPKNIDGIIGGPPCQSWSLAGSMKGINDERGSLFFDYIRLLKHAQPKFFVAENVKGIISKAHIAEFNNILDLFSEAGYNCQYKLLDAYDYEVPQTRERIFIVGFRKDLKVNFNFPKPSNNKLHLENILTGLEDAHPFGASNLNKTSIPNNEYLTGSFSSMYMSRNRRRGFNQPSFTIQAGGRHAPLHPSSPEMIKVEKDKFKFNGAFEDVRRMTVRECARAQTFPDNFLFKYKNINDAYKMIGNAVPINLAKAVALSIKEALQNT